MWMMFNQQSVKEGGLESNDLGHTGLYIGLRVGVGANGTSNTRRTSGKRENLVGHRRPGSVVAHWSGYANRNIGNKVTRGPMDRPHVVMAARQELKDSERACGAALLIKNSLNNVRRGYEDAILGNEEAGADSDKETVLALSDDWKNCMTGVRWLSIASLN